MNKNESFEESKINIPEQITKTGKEQIKKIKKILAKSNPNILYFDTDSVFIKL